jgi:hypothetical protein
VRHLKLPHCRGNLLLLLLQLLLVLVPCSSGAAAAAAAMRGCFLGCMVCFIFKTLHMKHVSATADHTP